MVHTALHVYPIVDRLPLKIESVCAWGRDRLLVGTAEGVLFVYAVRPVSSGASSSAPAAAGGAGGASAASSSSAASPGASSSTAGKPPFQVNLVDAKKQFARRSVSQLAASCRKPLECLVSLADQAVAVHDLPSFGPRGQLKTSKGCTLFALNEQVLEEMGENPPASAFANPLLACVVKKKLILYTWDPVARIFVDFRELPLPETPLAVQWCGDSGNLVLGFRKEYSLINYATGETTELFPTGGAKGKLNNIPIAALLPGDQVVLGRDMLSIFVGFDGKPTRKYGVSWTEPPLSVCHAHPYLLALTTKALEVRTMSRASSTSLVQTVPLKGATLLTVSLEADSEDARTPPPAQDPQQVIYVAAPNAVWRLQPMPMSLQIDQLVREREFEDALELCNCLRRSENNSDNAARIPDPEDREVKSAYVKLLYAHNLFSSYQYSQALEMLFALRVHPFHVLSLFPSMMSRAASRMLAEGQAAQVALLSQTMPAEEAQVFCIPGLPFGPKFILPPAHTSSRLTTTGGISTTNKPEALRALTEYLLQARAILRQGSADSVVDLSLDEVMSEDFALCSHERVVVDTCLATALLKLQLGRSDAAVAGDDAESLRSLFNSSHNLCHVAECRRMLQVAGRTWEEVLLLKSRGMNDEALKLLADAGQAKDAGASAPGSPSLKGPDQTVLFLRELNCHIPPMPASDGKDVPVEESAEIRRGKANTELVFKYSEWILEFFPQSSLKIFTNREPAQNRLPALRVLEHVRAHAKQLVVPLLEHSLSGDQITDPHLHNEMVTTYLHDITGLKRDPLTQQKLAKLNAEFRAQWASLRGSTAAMDPPPLPAGREPDMLGVTRRKLIAFLETSRYYIPERMLTKFPSDDLFEERAILLSRIGQHGQALHIYAHRLKDPVKAEQYCATHYSAATEGNRDVYLALLRVFLKPLDTETQLLRDSVDVHTENSSPMKELRPMIGPALELLNKYCDKVDVAKALELLPPDTPIASLVHVFEATVRRNNAHRRHDQIVKNLLQSENLQVREELIHARADVVYIGEDRMCPVCHKRLGSSVFAAYPSGTVVHYICSRDKSVDPVTGERFSESSKDS